MGASSSTVLLHLITVVFVIRKIMSNEDGFDCTSPDN